MIDTPRNSYKEILNWIGREMLTVISRNVFLMCCKNYCKYYYKAYTLDINSWLLKHEKRSIWKKTIVFINTTSRIEYITCTSFQSPILAVFSKTAC